MKVLNNYVIIDQTINETTSSGIIINNDKIKNVGIIVALDETITDLKVSDKVVYDESKVFSFVYNQKTLYACKYTDIICNLN